MANSNIDFVNMVQLKTQICARVKATECKTNLKAEIASKLFKYLANFTYL